MSDTFLEGALRSQQEYQERLGWITCPHPGTSNIDEEDIELIRRYALCTIAEMGELLEVVPWRWHRSGANGVVRFARQRYLEEWADTLAFVINLAVVVGATPEELESAWAVVVEKNRRRLESGQNVRSST